MDISSRIKEVRKRKGLSQVAFGQCLGVSRDVINNIENDRVELSEVMLKAICGEFAVSESWLRTGNGKMDDDNALISQLAKKYNLDAFSRKFVETYIELPESKRNVIKEFVQTLTSGSTDSDSASVDETIKLYRAARSETNTEHEVIDDSQDKIERLRHLHKVKNQDEL